MADFYGIKAIGTKWIFANKQVQFSCLKSVSSKLDTYR